jgi:hypothetical protein
LRLHQQPGLQQTPWNADPSQQPESYQSILHLDLVQIGAGEGHISRRKSF